MAFVVGMLATGAFFLRAEAAIEDQGLPATYWQHPLPAQGSPPAGWPAIWRDLDPQACAKCHQKQFGDWKKSLHARAFSPGLVGQFPGFGVQGSNSCLNCHAPLAEQKFSRDSQISEALRNLDKPPSLKRLPLRHAGVSCASCHVRKWRRHGPPPSGSAKTGQFKGPAHGGFYATRAFEKSQFCAACHQFPQSAAINGKPLENTLEEWKQSRFASEGIQCQNCHMPDRRHEFKGIHDPEMTRSGLKFDVSRTKHGGELTIQSIRIGHAFPTYVTPKILVEAEAVDGDAKILRTWSWDIIREVAFDGEWQEIRDERLMPGASRRFLPESVPANAQALIFRVKVIPDYFYKGLYRNLLGSDLKPEAANQIRKALDQAGKNDYLLYEKKIKLL
ncbi:MAG: multiheme c-type cytochrome [Mariprofundaceae bacterium]